MKKTYKRLTFDDRLQIKALVEKAITVTDIAEILKFHYGSIYRELQKGKVNGTYDPYYAERLYREKQKNKKTNMFALNKELADYVAKHKT